MQLPDILDLFRKSGALLEGHFQLTSGLHSNRYFQCALILQYPEYTEVVCRELIRRIAINLDEISTVISPAVGGIIVGQEIARLLNKRSIFAERQEGKMVLRRGFNLEAGEKVLVTEDVITTGGSVKEVVDLVRKKNAVPVLALSIVDRSGGHCDLLIPYLSSLTIQVEAFKPEECPLCQQNIPVNKPGSRHLTPK